MSESLTNLTHFESQRVLVLAPHPDDEIIACGGAILQYLAGDSKVVIQYANGKDRMEEAVAGAKALGVEDDRLYFCNPRDKLGSIRNLIKKFKPEVVYMPHLYERHDDHHELSLLARSILKSDKYSGHLFGYGVWHPVHQPDVVLDVTKVWDIKLLALHQHRSQIKDFDLIGLCRAVNHLYYMRERDGKNEVGFAEAFLTETL